MQGSNFRERAAARPYPKNEGDLTRAEVVSELELVGGWKEERKPSDLIASRLREAALLFENLIGKFLTTDGHELTRMGQGRRAGGRCSGGTR